VVSNYKPMNNMNEEKEGWWDRHSWPGPDQWYEGPLEVFETGEERFKKAQATTESTNKKKKT
tara:strand:+ start:1439 stop:1624 length:186 start_codon:yes stop_codon:yes gene_type:complete